LPGASFTLNVRVSPGLRLGSPVSPTLLASSTLLAPVVTGAGGSPASATGSWSKGVSVLSTIISCSMVPRFFTRKVTSPAGAELSNGTMLIGPDGPESSSTTSTGAEPWTITVCGVGDPTATPPSPAPGAGAGGAHAASV